MIETKVEDLNILKRRRTRPSKIESIEINKKIQAGLDQGKHQKKLSQELGLGESAISQRIKNMRIQGIEIPKSFNRKIDEIDKKILEGLSKGERQREIAIEQHLTEGAISRRISRMRERGIEIPNVPKKKKEIPRNKESIEIDKKILEALKHGEKQKDISSEIYLSESAISQRIKNMRERGIEIPGTIKEESELSHSIIKNADERDDKYNRKLAKEIVKLIYKKQASVEQIKIIGEYYGVDVEELLNSLDEQEK